MLRAKTSRSGSTNKSGFNTKLGMTKIRGHIFIRGRVQGVFFRENTRRQAQSRGVMGWVKNLDDGRVEAVFEGDESAVKALVEFCQQGPKGASVDTVTVEWAPFEDEFRGFNIVY
jgi:acylphosphatase